MGLDILFEFIGTAVLILFGARGMCQCEPEKNFGS